MNVATDDAHGAGLVERVIAAIHAEPARLIVDDEPWLTAPPRPMPAEALAAAALPSGRALPPSVRRWLAFDSSLLARWSWLTSGGRFTPRRLPVFALDVDDLPYVGVMYPGFDVYLAHMLGVVQHEHTNYESLIDDAVYGARMRQHARNWFGGDSSVEHPFPPSPRVGSGE